MLPSARLYLCARCRIQVLICRRCDRGQRYCTGGCAREARRLSRREAARRYAASRRGHFTHAERARRYRARGRNKVTHQGSRRVGGDAVVALMRHTPAFSLTLVPPGHCHGCGCALSACVRLGFLRHKTGPIERSRRTE